MTQYLLELGMEEIPARFLVSLANQLKERVATFLEEERLGYDTIYTYATPRRLSVLVEGVFEKQEDLSELVKGPSLKIAQKDGEWTKAALGFVKGQQCDVSDIVVQEVNGEEYIFVNKFVKGQSAYDVLSNIGRVIHQMTFPVTMIWNEFTTPFIRPVHWIVSLLEEEIVPVEFVGVKANRYSRGHRFLGDTATIERPSHYVEALRQQYVLVDFEERRQLIRTQIEALATENNWQVPIDESLLEEVTSIVEWPTAFYGTFEEKYLQVPHNVLITAMKDHQRYFYALNQHSELQPVFISVRNGNAEYLDNVVKGNRKVLRARLEDALFFYQEDLKHPLEHFVDKLKYVKEHFKLGSLYDKQQRVHATIARLGTILDLEHSVVEVAKRACEIYKFDLMTQVVGEFDELQGEMGGIYAQHYGEVNEVCQAISEQYLPTSSGGQLPQSQAGALLALADKMDTLSQYFNVGIIPTGSNDPYGLRRQAMGIVEILLSQQWQVSFNQLFEAVTTVESSVYHEQVYPFLVARMQQVLSPSHDVDIVQAILKGKATTASAVKMLEVAQYLQLHKQDAPTEYRQFVEAVTRVANIGLKESVENPTIDVALAQTESESALLLELNQAITQSVSQQLTWLQKLVPLITEYFEQNKVYADDATIRHNRLSTIVQLSATIYELFDPRELISKF